MEGNTFHMVENQQGQSKTPSCVAFSPEGRLVGSPAINNLTVHPENTIYGKYFFLVSTYGQLGLFLIDNIPYFLF